MFAYFVLIVALVIEPLLPDWVYPRAKAVVERIGQEFEIEASRLGFPKFQPYQWTVPVLVWMVVLSCLDRVLQDFQMVFSGLLGLLVLLYGLRFKHFADVYTSAQLFLNQGDFSRAKELLMVWMQDYGRQPPSGIETPAQLIVSAVQHGAERALRQFFCLLFWFLLLPGVCGLTLYLAVLWSVGREHQRWQAQHPNQDAPSIQHLFQHSLMQTALSPRSVLFVLEWLPTRLLLFTIALVSQFDDVVLSWRSAAQALHGLSNRGLLAKVCVTAVGLGVFPGAESEQLQRASSQTLRRFRQLIFRCALVWLLVAFVLQVLLGE